MVVNLSIKNVPDSLAERLRARAAANHRSLQGEMLAILGQAAAEVPSQDEVVSRLTARIKAIGHPVGSESVRMIREDRDRDR